MRYVPRPDAMPLRADPTTGLVEGIRFVPSPNCDARPPDCAPRLSGRLEVILVQLMGLL